MKIKKLLIVISGVTSLLLIPNKANASYIWNSNMLGNTLNYRIADTSGYSGHGSIRDIGGFIRNSYTDNYGSVNCSTYSIGNFIRTNCY